MTFLDEQYLTEWAAGTHEPLGSIAGTVVMKTTGSPDGRVNVSLTFEHGVLQAAAPGTTRGAALTLEAPWQLAADVVGGSADPAQHYMAGDLKASGDMAMWLELLRAWRDAKTLGAPPTA